MPRIAMALPYFRTTFILDKNNLPPQPKCKENCTKEYSEWQKQVQAGQNVVLQSITHTSQ